MSHVIAAINQDAPAQIYFLKCFFATRIYIYESERILLFKIECNVFNYNFKNNNEKNEKIFNIYKYFLSITKLDCDPKVEKHCFSVTSLLTYLTKRKESFLILTRLLRVFTGSWGAGVT